MIKFHIYKIKLIWSSYKTKNYSICHTFGVTFSYDTGFRAWITHRGRAATRESRPVFSVGWCCGSARAGPEDAVASRGLSLRHVQAGVIHARAASVAAHPGVNCARAGPQVPTEFFFFGFLFIHYIYSFFVTLPHKLSLLSQSSSISRLLEFYGFV